MSDPTNHLAMLFLLLVFIVASKTISIESDSIITHIVVVARRNERIGWLDDLLADTRTVPFVVQEGLHTGAGVSGNRASAWLFAILRLRQLLDDGTLHANTTLVFLAGDPTLSWPLFRSEFHRRTTTDGFVALGVLSQTAAVHASEIKRLAAKWHIALSANELTPSSGEAQFAIPAHFLRRRPADFYRRLSAEMLTEANASIVLDSLWSHIWSDKLAETATADTTPLRLLTLKILLWGVQRTECDPLSEFRQSFSLAAIVESRCKRLFGLAAQCRNLAVRIDAVSLIDAAAELRGFDCHQRNNVVGGYHISLRRLRVSCARGFASSDFDVLNFLAVSRLDIGDDLPSDIRTTQWDAIFVGRHACGPDSRFYLRALYTARLLALTVVRNNNNNNSSESFVVIDQERELSNPLTTIRNALFDKSKTLLFSVREIAYTFAASSSAKADGFPRNNTVIVLMVTSGVLEMFFNFFSYYSRLHLGVRRVVVLCFDDASFEALLPLTAFNEGEFDVRAAWNITSAAFSTTKFASVEVWGSSSFKQLMRLKPLWVLQLMDEGFDAVVLSDIDIVYLRDPLDYVFNSASFASDVWAALDNYQNLHFRYIEYNTGFMVFRRSPHSVAMLQKWRDACQRSDDSEQTVLRTVVNSGEIAKFGILPEEKFPNGFVYFVIGGATLRNLRFEVAIAHVTATADYDLKIIRLREQLHWLLP
jgi:hypothetical protein